jgi:hypothetical protein
VECSDFSKPIYHVNAIDISKAEMVKAEEGVAGEQVKAEQGAGEMVKTEQAEVDQQLKSQIEFCFSDSNLPKNKFLLQPTKKTPEGWVSLKTISEFKKMRDMGAPVSESLSPRTYISENFLFLELIHQPAGGETCRRRQSIRIPGRRRQGGELSPNHGASRF